MRYLRDHFSFNVLSIVLGVVSLSASTTFADTAKIQNIDSPWVHIFFQGAEIAAAGEMSADQKAQFSQFSSFVTETQKAADIKSKWDFIFSDYIRDAKNFIKKNGNIEIEFASDVPAYYQARELRRLQLKVQSMKATERPSSLASVTIFASQAMKDDANRTFGAGTSAKLGMDADHVIAYHSRTFNLEKRFVSRLINTVEDEDGITDIKITLNLEDGTSKEIEFPKEWKENRRKFGVGASFYFDRSGKSYSISDYPLLSKEIGTNRAVFVDDNGVYTFAATADAMPEKVSKAFVDSAEAAYKVLMKTSEKKISMLPEFNGEIPAIAPNLCSSL